MFNYLKEYRGLIKALDYDSVGADRIMLSPAIVQSRFEHISAIIFEVTEGCNLNCEYCGYGENYVDTKYRPRGRNAYLNWETAKPLIDYYLSIWNSSNQSDYYVSFYGGEPLLNFQVIQQITDYLEENKSDAISIHYNMTTNGVLLHKYIDFLAKHDFRVAVSLDGDEKANIFRQDKKGDPSFQIVKRNIDLIQERYPSYFETKIAFQAVVTRNSSVLNVYRYFDRQYHKRPLAIEISTDGLAPNNNIRKYYNNLNHDVASNYSENASEYEKYNVLSPWLQRVEYSIKTLSFSNMTNYYTFLESGMYMNSKSPTCKPIAGRILLSATGLLYQCEKVKFDFPLGQVIDGKILFDFEGIAQEFNRIFANFESQCSRCLHQLNCEHCMATSYGYSEDDHKCIDFEAINEDNLRQYVSPLRDFSKEFNAMFNRKKLR